MPYHLFFAKSLQKNQRWNNTEMFNVEMFLNLFGNFKLKEEVDVLVFR